MSLQRNKYRYRRTQEGDRRSTNHHQYVSSPVRRSAQFDFDIYLYLSDIRSMIASVMQKIDRLETKLDNLIDSENRSEERKREPQEALSGSNSHHQRDRFHNLLLYLASLIIMLLLMYSYTLINHTDKM